MSEQPEWQPITTKTTSESMTSDPRSVLVEQLRAYVERVYPANSELKGLVEALIGSLPQTPETTQTCETRGHLYGAAGVCIFCQSPRKVPWKENPPHGPVSERFMRHYGASASQSMGQIGVADEQQVPCSYCPLLTAPQTPEKLPDIPNIEDVASLDYWQRAHRDAGHCITAHEQYMECSCGALYRFQKLTASLPQIPETWQPIATAPKDGTVIIGYDSSRDDDDGLPHGVDFMRWFDGAWIDPLTHILRPTHWMPLPAAPQAPGPETT